MLHTMLDNYRPVTVDGFELFVNPVSGRVRPVIRGGAEGEPPNPPPNPPATFTQADLDRFAGAARVEARRAAANDLAEQLGCTVDEAKAKIQAATDAEEARKDDLTKAQDAARDAEARATKATEAAARTAAETQVREALIDAGMPVKGVKNGLRLVDVDPADDAAAVAVKVAALAEELPALFAPVATDPAAAAAAVARNNLPAPRPPAGNGTKPKTFEELGREALRAAGIRPRDNAA